MEREIGVEMNCKQARAQSSLMAGNDLDNSAVTELQRHLAVCPDCRDFSGRMTASMSVLQEVCCEFTYTESSESDRSLWPRIADAVSARQPHQSRNRWFNGSVATLAIAATFLAALSIVETLNPPEVPDAASPSNFQGAAFQHDGSPPRNIEQHIEPAKKKTDVPEFDQPQ